jgi:hypothetical protein
VCDVRGAGGDVVTGGEVTVGATIGGELHRFLVRPGVQQRVQVLALLHGVPVMVDVDLLVYGTVCPDPAEHTLECAETDHSTRGDCDGRVRPYVAAGYVGGVAPGESVNYCASHAQQHGKNLRRHR